MAALSIYLKVFVHFLPGQYYGLRMPQEEEVNCVPREYDSFYSAYGPYRLVCISIGIVDERGLSNRQPQHEQIERFTFACGPSLTSDSVRPAYPRQSGK